MYTLKSCQKNSLTIYFVLLDFSWEEKGHSFEISCCSGQDHLLCMKALLTHKSIRGSISLEQRNLPTRARACGVGGWIVPSTSAVSSRLCAVLREPLEMVLMWADTLHSDLLIPWFNLCLLPLWSRLKSLYLFNRDFFFLILTEGEFCMLWEFNHVMFSVLIGVFVKRMSNLFVHAPL